MLKKTTQAVLMGGAFLASLNVMASSAEDVQYRAALVQVKAGHYSQGLPVLKQLMLQNPSVSRYRYDYLATLGWAQRDDEVLALSRSWELNSAMPIYVLEAVGRSARLKKNYSRALEAYEAALKQSPKRVFSQVGRALAKLGLGRPEEADLLMRALENQEGFRRELEQGFFDYYLASSDRYDSAVQLITKLRAKYPSSVFYRQQEVTVLSWVGRPQDAYEQAKLLPMESFQPYLLEVLGRSARDARNYPLAAAYYEMAIKKGGARPEARVGYVMSLLDSVDVRRHNTVASPAVERAYVEREKQQLSLALGLLEPLDPLQQPRLDVKEAWLRLQDTVRLDDYKILMAARAIQERHDPKHLAAATAEIDALNRQGAPHLASLHPLFEQVRAALRWDVQLNEVGQEVRNGQSYFQSQTGEARYQKSEESLKHAEQVREALLKSEFPEKQAFIDRLDYDRMIALNDVRRYEDVIQIYQELEARSVSMPYYAHVAAASSYLSLKTPAKARDVFQKALELKPRDPIASVGLHYAYFDNAQYEEALYVANWELALPSRDAKDYAAMAYAYSEYLGEAESRMEALVKEFPADYELHRNLAAINLYRGKPKEADERYKWVAGATPNDHQVHAGRVSTNIALQDYPEAEKSLEKAETLAPREEPVKKSRREWETHNLRELTVHAGYNRGNPAGAINGEATREPQVSWRLYSQPLKYDWRIFTEGGYVSESMPATSLLERDAAGNLVATQNAAFKTQGYYAGVGVDYRHLAHSAELSLGGTRYSNDVVSDAGVTSVKRLRVAGAYKYQFNDQWSVDTQGEINAINSALGASDSSMSIRASQEGIRANRLVVGATWAANESRRARLGLDFTKFSDGNRRWAWFSGWTEQLVVRPTYRLSASLDIRMEGNSLAATTVSYYNPERETYVGGTLTQEWVIDQFYEKSWKHRLGLSLGKIYQRGYSTKRAEGVRYDHILTFYDRANLEIGLGRNRRYYDGQADYISNVSSTLSWRF